MGHRRSLRRIGEGLQTRGILHPRHGIAGVNELPIDLARDEMFGPGGAGAASRGRLLHHPPQFCLRSRMLLDLDRQIWSTINGIGRAFRSRLAEHLSEPDGIASVEPDLVAGVIHGRHYIDSWSDEDIGRTTGFAVMSSSVRSSRAALATRSDCRKAMSDA